MTRITDDITFTALRGFNKRPGYSHLERMRDALEAALPHLEGAAPTQAQVEAELKRHGTIRWGETPSCPCGHEYARHPGGGVPWAAQNAHRAAAVLALIGGAS